MLTRKSDILQEMEAIKNFEKMEAQKNYKKQQQQEIRLSSGGKSHQLFNRQSINITKINSELKELKDFVNECNKNLSNYKTDIDKLKHKRHTYPAMQHRQSPHFNTLRMSFPSYTSTHTKSNASFLSNSIQNSHTRSLKSLHSTLSSRISSSNTQLIGNKVNDSEIGGNLSKIPTAAEKQSNHHEFVQTPTILAKQIRGNLNKYNTANISSATDATLVQSSLLSMGNIDTPITVDNKSKCVKMSEQKAALNDSQFPMTPTKMPNLSMINIKEEDNIAADFDEDDGQPINENPLEDDEDEEKRGELDDETRE